MMHELAGNDALISLEGDLSRCRFPGDLVTSRDETINLKRQTLVPTEDFIVLRLTSEMVAPIFEQIASAGLTCAIVHVQIARKGVTELGAYDNFHPECVVTGSGVSTTLLDELKDKRIIRDYQIAASSS
ncbi:MAG: hypothetical protein IH623_11990 [Verrucomicrobia bacterium]|nr:hypothetical protein [Verrucomicrobiota bacterium]